MSPSASPKRSRKMPHYKLTYFNLRALAEPIRLIFSYSGTEFEDYRFDEKDWRNIKKTMPYGVVPVLDIDGKRVHQSIAICRYLAKQFGLSGKDDWEDLEIDMTIDSIDDLRNKLAAYNYESHPVAKERNHKVVLEIVPYYVERFDEQVKKNGGYFVGGRVTLADIYFVGILDYLDFMSGFDIVDKAENLKELIAKILALPNIKAWLDKRPETVF